MKIYFAGPGDTVIANEDASFLRRLELAARSHAGVQAIDDAERADIIAVDETYAYKTWAYADVLRACPFVNRHGGRIAVLNHDDHARVFLPGLYVSLERSRPPLLPALPIPYKSDLWKIEIPAVSHSEDPRLLWAFRGTCRTHWVRREIWDRLHRDARGVIDIVDRQLHAHAKEDQLAFVRTLVSGAFALCPRGYSPSTYRVYESMQLGRCPVIISDDWTAPAAVDWGACSIRIPEAEIGTLADALVARRQAASELGRRARAEWERCLSWPARLDGFLDRLLEVSELPGFGASFEALSSRWRSGGFRSLYGWTFRGRLRSRLKREIEAVERRRFETRLKAAGGGAGVSSRRAS